MVQDISVTGHRAPSDTHVSHMYLTRREARKRKAAAANPEITPVTSTLRDSAPYPPRTALNSPVAGTNTLQRMTLAAALTVPPSLFRRRTAVDGPSIE